ncbi:DUF6114 domain-containing protein [Pseudonocardia alni]|uniref:Uncharacterized protein n=1 Tax=Pseudonocardia alni TaxID=33907 RepID=A0AA44ZNC3_PSEA5|nr:DUF6114 domain-containing protein [Pseudonocardia alni]PKB29677.1 hypothetical protein ATL51_1315 [Pseudonocardia alni]
MSATDTRWRFRRWRYGRPFWAGALLLTSALVFVAVPFATLRVGDLVVSLATPGGSAAVLVAAVLACCGGALWAGPSTRVPCGIVAMVAALVGVATTNLGGLVIGSVLGVLGGAAALAWTADRGPRAR